MSWDYALASTIASAGRPPSITPVWYRCSCVSAPPDEPLRFSALGDALLFEGAHLTLTRTSRAVEWQVGMQAVGLLSGSTMLIIDAL